MNRVWRRLALAMGCVLVVCLAYVLGAEAAGWIKEWNLNRDIEAIQAQAAEHTNVILRKMGTIKVGDTIPDFSFEDIGGEVHLLREIVTDRTLISYIKPDCDACLVEMEGLRQAVSEPKDFDRVLVVSSSNPLHLQRIREDYGLECRMLFDEERLFGNRLRIQTYPFNVIVNRSREVLEIHANALLPVDYQRLFADKRGL